MKEYEKLAKELADNAGIDPYGDLEYGFIRGFLKAREMALQMIDAWNSDQGDYTDTLSKLGEKEV